MVLGLLCCLLMCQLIYLLKTSLYPSGGVWNIHVLFDTLLSSEREVILAIPVAKFNCQDKMIWHFDKRGEYTVKSGYRLASSLL